MRSLLLPHGYKKIGWILFIPSIVLGLLYKFFPDFPFSPMVKTFGLFGNELQGHSNEPFRFGQIDLIKNLTSILLLVGGLLVMFAKEKKEDEYINQIRLNSLQFSVFLNYVLLFVCIVFIHGFAFLDVMVYNLFTVILIYIIRFHFLIYKNSTTNHE